MPGAEQTEGGRDSPFGCAEGAAEARGGEEGAGHPPQRAHGGPGLAARGHHHRVPLPLVDAAGMREEEAAAAVASVWGGVVVLPCWAFWPSFVGFLFAPVGAVRLCLQRSH